MTSGARARTAVAAALLATVATAPSSVAAGTPPCEVVAFSPTFAADRTMFCARAVDQDVYGFEIFRSTDRGRTWQRRARVMPPDAGPGNDATPMAIHVDHAYAANRTIYVHVGSGLFQAADDGASVSRLASSQLGYPFRVTPYRDGVPGAPGSTRTAFANGRGNVAVGGTYVFEARAGELPEEARKGRPVVGTPIGTTFFIIPPDYAERRMAVAIGHEVGARRAPDGHIFVGVMDLAAFACTGDFVCAQRIAGFGESAILSRAGSTGTLHWLKAVDTETPRATVHRSDDYGRTWRPWTSVNRLFAPDGVKQGLFPSVSVTTASDAPRRVFLRLAYGPGDMRFLPRTPIEQVFRSDDNGETWRRIGYALVPGQPGRDRGNLPFNGAGRPGKASVFRDITAQPGGRLYVVAGTQTGGRYGVAQTFAYDGLYCSPDLGRTWRRGGGC